MKKSTKQLKEPRVTISDVLWSVNKLSDEFAKDMGQIKQRLDNVEQDLSGVKQDLSSVKQKLNSVESTVNTQMVTKDYLDRKLIELRGVNKLTNLLQKKKVITTLEAKMVLSI